jgi:hypothetical protein
MITAAAVHRRMLTLASPERAKASQWFFKTGPGQYGEGDRFLGITVPVLRQLTREYQALALPAIRTVLKSRWLEERLLAQQVLVRQYATADPPAREAIYRCYLASRGGINNWDLATLPPRKSSAHTSRRAAGDSCASWPGRDRSGIAASRSLRPSTTSRAGSSMIHWRLRASCWPIART